MLRDLTSARLRLQPATGSDVDALWALWTEPDVRRFLWDDVRISRDEAAAMLSDCQKHQPRGLGLWSLRPREGDDGEIIGCAALLPVGAAAEYAPHMAGGVEPLIALHPAVWRRGYAAEALAVVIAYAFADLGLAELVAAVDVPNTASHSLLTRLGFVAVGESAGPRYLLRSYRLPSDRMPTAGRRGLMRRRRAASAELAALVNLGSVSAGWLEAAGIHTAAELRALGAVEAFRRVAFHRGGDVTFNLLYALEGALREVRWDHLPPEERAELRRAAETLP